MNKRDLVIINADDFGHSVERTDAIVKSIEIGLVDRTSIMMNMPDCERAIKIAFAKGFEDKIGLHLNLTEGSPLTNDIKHMVNITTNGKFDKKILSYVRKHFLTKDEKEAISKEIDAQIKAYINSGFNLMHIDSHHHIHTEWQILSLILPYSKDFKSMRISRNLLEGSGLKTIIKKFYKGLINQRIDSKFATTKYFGDMSDLNKRWDGNSFAEFEIHPEFINGELVDRVSNSILIPISDYSEFIRK